VIREMRRTYPKIELKWHRYLNHIEAMKFISESRGLLVSPSLMDNSPFTLIEAMSYAVPVLASRVGGIPEIIGIDEVLFEPNDKALAAAIQNAANVDFGSLNYTYSAEKANQEWLEFHRTLESWRRPTREPSPLRPKVSVCIFHHNMGDYLEKAIESIAQNTYESFEVICVDDGSTNETDMQRFSRIESKYGHFGWRVERQETSGIGKALNRAASLARGDFLIFMDVDSIARPDMIETMVRAIQSSENDCLTCHSLGYASLEAADTTNPILRYAPLGPCLELSCIENVFGGGSFIIKKEVFESVGGFVEDTPSSCEDWEFLSKLALKGYKMDVVPEAVLLRQVTDPGHGRTIESYANYHRILRPWRQVADAHIHNIAFLSLTLHSQVSGGALSIISTLDLLAGAIRSRLEAGRLKAFAPFFGKCFSAAKHVLSFFGVGR
jgi:GT2 family glycosyltransferase